MLSKTKTTTSRPAVEQDFIVPPAAAITIVIAEIRSRRRVLIRADFKAHPSIIFEIKAGSARFTTRGGKA